MTTGRSRDWGGLFDHTPQLPGACRTTAKVVDVTGRVWVGRPLAAGGVTVCCADSLRSSFSSTKIPQFRRASTTSR